MKVYIIVLIIVFSSCVSNSSKSEKISDLPVIITSLKEDTLRVGEILELEIQFSDTSLLYFPEVDGTKTRIFPPFKINGEFVENESYVYLHKEQIQEHRDSLDEYIWGEVVVEVVFPNPTYGEGDVTLSKVVPYVIVNE